MGLFDGLLGSLVSGVAGIFGSNENADAIRATNAANIAEQDKINSENIALQKEFAQSGLQWRAADATAAQSASGINRLALLGAPTASFSNLVGAESKAPEPGNGLIGLGQDVGRALNAFVDKNDRAADLDNKLKEAQIANVNSDTVKNQAVASKAVTQAPTAPTPLYQDFVDDKGRHFRLPSGKASSAMQNWASLPAQVPIAITQLGDAVQSEYHILADPIKSWWDTHGWGGVRGDVGRYVSTPDVRGLGY